MFDLDTQLRDYFKSTTPTVTMEDVVLRLERVAPSPTVVPPTRRPLPGWALAALAVIVVVVAVGGAAWMLSVTEPDVGPAETLPGIPATIVTVPISTVPDTEAAARGLGPEIRWIQLKGAPLSIQGIAWFGDAFYGLGQTVRGPALYRSSDGTVWETVEGFLEVAPSYGSATPDGLVAGVDGLVVVLSTSSDQAFNVATSRDGTEWNLTRIEVGVPGSPPAAAGASVFPGPAAVGSTGFLVAASMEAGFDYESLIASEFGQDVVDDLAHLQVAGDRILFSTQDGTDHELALSDVGLTTADLAVPGGGTRAWWSPDGVTWQEAVREGPMLSPGFSSVVPVADGFLVARQGVGLWKTGDGSSWEKVDATYSDARLFDWNGTPFEYRYLGQSFRALGSTEALPVSEAFDDGYVEALAVGEAGVIAALGQTTPVSVPGDPSPVTMVYSPDGIEWRRWVPDEIAETGAFVNSFAVGSDRVLLLTLGQDVVGHLWVGVPEE